VKAANAKLSWALVLVVIVALQIPGCLPVPEYMLTVTVDGGGQVVNPALAPDPNDPTRPAPFAGGAFPEGSEIELIPVADDGYRFVRWEGDVAPENEEDVPLIISVTADMSVTAVFIANFTLALNTDGEGRLEVNGAEVAVPFDKVYDGGSEVVLAATPTEGWRFLGWEGDVPAGDEQENPLTVSVDSGMSLTAVFVRQLTLTVNAEGEGRIEVDGAEVAVPFDEVLDDGHEVVLTATPAEGWWFLGWEGDYSGADASLTLTIEADTAVTAVFALVTGDRDVTAAGVTGHMTLALQNATVKGVWRHNEVGLDLDGTISGDEIVVACSAPLTESATITATLQRDGTWIGTIDGSGFENDPFTAALVGLAGTDDGRAAVRATSLPGWGATGQLAAVSEDGVLRGTWRVVGNFGFDVEGTVAEDQITFTATSPMWLPFTADVTVQTDGSWVGVLNGSGFVDEPFEADAPFFP
jgi:hypothetical protein